MPLLVVGVEEAGQAQTVGIAWYCRSNSLRG